MKGILRRVIFLIALMFAGQAFHAPARAQVCIEGCYLWCKDNRPTESCRADCVGRPTCLTGGADQMRARVCREWCTTNKPGNYACLGDCEARDKKFGPPKR